MWDQIALLESKYARLAAIQTTFNDSRKGAVLETTLQEISDFESLITSVSVMSEKDTTWRHLCNLFLEEAKCLKNRGEADVDRIIEEIGRLAEASGKFNRNNNIKRGNRS